MLRQKEVRGEVGGRAPRQWQWTKPPSTWDYLRFIQRQKKPATCFPSNILTRAHIPRFPELAHEQTFTHSRISEGIPVDICIPAGIPRHMLACRPLTFCLLPTKCALEAQLQSPRLFSERALHLYFASRCCALACTRAEHVWIAAF